MVSGDSSFITMSHPAKPHTHMGKRRKPMNWFSLSWLACTCTMVMVTAEFPKMVANLLQLTAFNVSITSFFDIGHLCFGQLTPVKTLGICWPVSHDHIAGSSLELIKVTCFFGVVTADARCENFGVHNNVLFNYVQYSLSVIYLQLSRQLTCKHNFQLKKHFEHQEVSESTLPNLKHSGRWYNSLMSDYKVACMGH